MNVLWVVVPCIVVFAYVIYGITGFGSAIVLVPVLSFVLPVKLVVPLVTSLGFLAAVTLSIKERRAVVTDELWRMIPGIALGIACGVYLLAHLPSYWLLPPLGALILWFGISGFIRPGQRQPIGQRVGFPAGVLAGTIDGMLGTGGPIYVMYLARRLPGKSELRATLSTLFILSGGARIVGYTVSGLTAGGHLLLLGIGLYPCVLLGMFVGNRLHHALSVDQVRRGVYLLLIGSGISLLVKMLRL